MTGSPDWQPTPQLVQFDLESAAPRKGVRGDAWRTAARFAFDVAERMAALSLLALLLPGLAAAAAAVALLSGHPPLIAHARVGYRGNRIWLLKLRTMWGPRAGHPRVGCALIERIEGSVVPERKTAQDPRITSRFAAFCRKHSIDELPQLCHVAAGAMSLVGPRPMTRDELVRWYGPSGLEILHAKPGLTGLWQVMGRNKLTYPQRRRLDLFLVRNWSPGLYLRVLLRTIPSVLSGKDAA